MKHGSNAKTKNVLEEVVALAVVGVVEDQGEIVGDEVIKNEEFFIYLFFIPLIFCKKLN